jgi:WD40 repeat protein/uncharacterized caspase-like protein
MIVSWLRLVLSVGAVALCASTSFQPRPAFAASSITIVPNIRGGSLMALSPDGGQVLSAANSTVKLWDAATGRLLRTFIGHTEEITAVAFSPNGATAASSSDDDTVKLWDVATGQLLHTFSQENLAARSIGFSPDGKRLLIGSNGISMIDLATAQVIFRIVEDYVGPVAFSPDGLRIISGSLFSNSVKMWDSTSGRLIREFKGLASATVPVFTPGHNETSPVSVASVAFSPDGERIMAGTSDQQLYNPSGISDHVVNIWDAGTGKLITTFTGHSASIGAVAFSPDGKLAWSGSGDNTVKIWTVVGGKLLRTISTKDAVTAIKFSPDGKEVLWNADGLQLMDAASGRPIRGFGSADVYWIESVSFSSTGMSVASGSASGVIRIWDLNTGALRQSFAGGDLVKYLPYGNQMLSTDKEGVGIWDPVDGKRLRSFGEPPSEMEAVAVSHDGTRVLLGNKMDDKPLELWDIATGKLVRRFMAFSRVGAIAFSPDDHSIGASLGAAVKFWDTASGKSLRAFTPFPNWGVMSLAFSRNGKEILFGGSARASISPVGGVSNLKVVDASSGGTLREFFGHLNSVGALAISPDGTRALSGSDDGTLRLWDFSSGKLLYTFIGSQGAINAVGFSPDGKRVLAGGNDGAVRIWNIANGELLVSMFDLRGGDWVTITPEGFFVASERGAEHLSVVQGLKVFGIDQVYQSLYRPDLVREKLAGDPRGRVREAAARLDLDKVIASGAAPAVTIVSPRDAERAASTQITAEAEIAGRDGGIGRVEWRVNGITAGVDTPKPGIPGQPIRLTRDLVVDEGENVVEVVAYNSNNLIASVPARATVTAPAPAGASQARLFVLAVGLNKYAESRFALTYAVPDAEALVQALRFTGKDLYKEVDVTLLSNEEVRRGQLDDAFSALAARVKPTDVFVFYIAGHGKTVDGRYYFVPQDFIFDGDRANKAMLENAVVTQGIGQDQWQTWFARIPARKSVLLFDTCEAGTLTGDATLSLEQGAASDRIAQATGRNILTASAGDKEALEGFRGHGLFTYSVLEALERGDSNGDGKIDVAELAAYVHAKVTALSDGVFKQLQVPQIRITANYPVAEPAQVLPSAPPDLVIADKPTDILAAKAELLMLPALGAREVHLLPAETPLTRLRSEDGWTLVAAHGQPIGYVATRELVPVR